MRASNIQDLIYKRGQAGVTKASVTIVFDNSDKERSPVAFENYPTITVTRQIAMGGVSKYLINGHKATQQAVQNLFQSVQLNINNPNFLIMQGKITKVLNMKPAEILSMIEEATGTRMFEERKERAFRTMAKKDQKVREIETLLDEEIKPKLDKLREEKRAFLEYQKASSELERLNRLAKAHEWHVLRSKLDDRQQNGIEHTRDLIHTQQDERAAWVQHMSSLQAELAKLEERRATELASHSSADGRSAMEHAKALAHELVEATAQQEFRQTAYEEEKHRVETEEAALAAAQAACESQQHTYDDLASTFVEFKREHDDASAKLAEQESLLQTLLTGMSTGSQDTQGGFQGQLAKARDKEAAAQAEIQQARMRIAHLEKDIEAKCPQVEREVKENRQLTEQLHKAQRAAQRAKADVDALGWNAPAYEQLHKERQALQSRIEALSQQHEAMQERLPASLQFTYADPTPNFDRSQVKGLIASLVRLDPSRTKYATALETCAGGRLYSVVVENEQVGAQILAKGQLKKRVTLIPLTKIQAQVVPPAKVAAAQQLAPGKVDLALSLVGYERDVAKALEYVFGTTLICADAATAKKVTFDAAVRMKSVTLEGDIYDPAGTLSGGSANTAQANILLRMQEVAQVAAELHAQQRALHDTDAAWAKLSAEHEKVQRHVAAYELQQHQADLLQQQVDGSRAAQLQAEIEAGRASLAALQTSIEEAQARQADAASQCAQLERDMAELGTNKEAKVSRVRDECKAMKAAHAKQAQTLKKRQAALRAAELDLGQHRMDAEAAQERLSEAQTACEQALQEQQQGAAACDALRQRVAEAEAKVEAEQAALSAFSDEVNTLQATLAAKKAAISEADVAIKQAQRDLEQHEQVCHAMTSQLSALEEDYPWILDDAPLFGQANTPYEFSKHNMKDVQQLCKQLGEQQSGMKRRINPRVMHMIDNIEKKDASLQNMLSTVLRDKSKIEQTIEELDRYKKDALQATFEQVNRDFGSIFGELLPGNYAKLQPPDGADITQGLEVRVRLGQTWKQSLTELSGGQRSLIALSLIMSLLQFNPAPMYILDEVDAALDLSHTQHIGHLFRTRFKGSQFIVVSLKEGLFSNANVLFRARFRDGTSVVERIAQKSHEAEKENRALPPLASSKRAPRTQRPPVAP